MKINSNAIIQYFLIYLMLVFNGSNLYIVFSKQQPTLYWLVLALIIGLAVCGYIFKPKKYKIMYCSIILAIIFACIILVRYTAGGVGVTILVEYAAHIFLTFLAICVNKEKFTQRFINTVYVLAIISLICYVIQIINPEILKMFLKRYDSIFGRRIWENSYKYTVYYQPAWGQLFFSMREGEMGRNLGMFSEPANYQIVLNSVLFLLLFCQNYFAFSKKEYIRRIVVILLALLTCQSTTGYICMFILVIAFLFNNREMLQLKGMKNKIFGFIAICALLLVIDYFVRGADSFFGTAITGKIIGTDNNLDLSASTGAFRIGTIAASLGIMFTKPLGVGFDRAFTIIEAYQEGAAGGALMLFGGALGVIPFLSVIIWTIKPVIKTKFISLYAKIAYIVFFLYTGFAQSKVFYPCVIMIPLLILFCIPKKTHTPVFDRQYDSER